MLRERLTGYRIAKVATFDSVFPGCEANIVSVVVNSKRRRTTSFQFAFITKNFVCTDGDLSIAHRNSNRSKGEPYDEEETENSNAKNGCRHGSYWKRVQEFRSSQRDTRLAKAAKRKSSFLNTLFRVTRTVWKRPCSVRAEIQPEAAVVQSVSILSELLRVATQSDAFEAKRATHAIQRVWFATQP